MAENEKQTPGFKRKLGNTTYTVRVHVSKDTDKTFKDGMLRLIVNDCINGEKNMYNDNNNLGFEYQLLEEKRKEHKKR